MYDITWGSKWCPTHIVLCSLFFSDLCTICLQFLWMVHFWLPLRYSIACIYNLLNLQKHVTIIYIYFHYWYILYFHKSQVSFIAIMQKNVHACFVYSSVIRLHRKTVFSVYVTKAKNYIYKTKTLVLTWPISDYIPLIIYFVVNLLQCIQLY